MTPPKVRVNLIEDQDKPRTTPLIAHWTYFTSGEAATVQRLIRDNQAFQAYFFTAAHNMLNSVRFQCCPRMHASVTHSRFVFFTGEDSGTKRCRRAWPWSWVTDAATCFGRAPSSAPRYAASSIARTRRR
jgi:hypothetical protein